MASETSQLTSQLRAQQSLDIHSPEPQRSLKSPITSPLPAAIPGKQKGHRNKPHAERGNRSNNSPLPELDGVQIARDKATSDRNRGSNPGLGADTPQKKAYAGPVFHASPEATSLPIPKFFNKSAPSALHYESHQALPDGASDSSAAATPGEELEPNSGSVTQRTESPLDFLFMAQKQERESQGTVFDHPAPLPFGSSSYPTQPLHASLNYQERQTPFRHPGSQPTSGKASLMMETDWPIDRHRVIDTSNMVSFQDRLGAMDIKASPSQHAFQADHDEEFRKAKTAELKKMLFSQMQHPSISPADGGSRFRGSERQEFSNFGFEEDLKAHAGSSAPITPTGSPLHTRHSTLQMQDHIHDHTTQSDDSSPRRKGRRSQRRTSSHQRTAVMNASRVAELPAAKSPQKAHRSSSAELASLIGVTNHDRTPTTYDQTAEPLPGQDHVPTTPSSNDEQPATQASVKKMEEDLKRILKLGT